MSKHASRKNGADVTNMILWSVFLLSLLMGALMLYSQLRFMEVKRQITTSLVMITNEIANQQASKPHTLIYTSALYDLGIISSADLIKDEDDSPSYLQYNYGVTAEVYSNCDNDGIIWYMSRSRT